MDHYPDYLNKCVWVRGARLAMRAARPEDAPRLLEFCRRMPAEANPFRLSLPVGALAAPATAELALLDAARSVTIVVEQQPPVGARQGAIVALGSYRVEPVKGAAPTSPNRLGELGILVSEEWRQEVESTLIHHVLTAAIEFRIDGLFGIAVRRLPEMRATLAASSELAMLSASESALRVDFDFSRV
ncbi:MAG: hypothetical protein HYY96_12175 [Candidatus Tectomicrobia bacterium]|nr:hypothetical protein [Candidatus Tectomicrobia bacterium]